MIDNEATYQYHDGNNNQYLIFPDSLQYLPMQAQFSSSGLYSGGDAYLVALSEGQYAELEACLEAAFASKSEQIEQRTKGSGLLQKGQQHCILAMASPSQKKLEICLRQLAPK